MAISEADPPAVHPRRLVEAETPLGRMRMFDLELVDAPDEATVADLLMQRPLPRHGHLDIVLTPNVDHVVRLAQGAHPHVEGIYRTAEWVLPDGQPLVVLSRLLKAPLRARLAGSTLFEHMWSDILTHDRPVVVVAANQQIADGLSAESPTSRFVVPPRFIIDDDTMIADIASKCVEHACDIGAEFVFSGLSFGKDARIAAEINARWPTAAGRVPSAICLGASFEFHLGLRRRAPMFVQRAGFEWLFRFGQEPLRLFPRYFIRDPRFFGLALGEIRAARRGQAHRGPRSPTLRRAPLPPTGDGGGGGTANGPGQ